MPPARARLLRVERAWRPDPPPASGRRDLRARPELEGRVEIARSPIRTLPPQAGRGLLIHFPLDRLHRGKIVGRREIALEHAARLAALVPDAAIAGPWPGERYFERSSCRRRCEAASMHPQTANQRLARWPASTAKTSASPGTSRWKPAAFWSAKKSRSSSTSSSRSASDPRRHACVADARLRRDCPCRRRPPPRGTRVRPPILGSLAVKREDRP